MRRFYKMCETYTLLYIDNFQKLQKKFKISFKKVWIGKIDKEYSSVQKLRFIHYQINMSYCQSQSLHYLYERWLRKQTETLNLIRFKFSIQCNIMQKICNRLEIKYIGK